MVLHHGILSFTCIFISVWILSGLSASAASVVIDAAAVVTPSVKATNSFIQSASKQSQTISWLSHFDWRASLAGGLAGGITNVILLPVDTLKTMRQSDPSVKSILHAFRKIQSSGLVKLYSGLWPACVGSIPSSAIYFGSYETAKNILYQYKDILGLSRPFTHMIAAMSGNIASSVIFVPKDVIKQQMQAYCTDSRAWKGVIRNSKRGISTLDVIRDIFAKRGIKGFYPSYRATLCRNIPSAVIRFTLYEELKILSINGKDDSFISNIKFMVAGGLASALSSIATTPFDVVKTRLATGVIPPGTPIVQALHDIARIEGVNGLFAGAQARLLYSAAFGGVGFACFEACKQAVAKLDHYQLNQT